MAQKTKMWRSRNLNAEFLSGRFADFAYDMHSHDTACLSLITEGEIRIRMRGMEFTARKGDLYAIDADVAHAGWPVDGCGWSLKTVYVESSAMRVWALHDDKPLAEVGIAGPIIQDNRLRDAFLRLHSLADEQGTRLAYDQAAADFADYFLSRHIRESVNLQTDGLETIGVRRAKEFLSSNVTEKVSLADLANFADLPPFRLYRAFQREAGMTPHEFQRQARVRVATEMIRNGDSLADVAAAAGFVDQAHFTKTFVKHLAITPGVYRDMPVVM
ncbi:AraC-like DNA-binding protein [Phyllobacterium trifolii]|uniref:AraC-like DNA-binding protein n=1 Tax=Phyllobacterium trifolii TaxID=300193 RepID=A0A839UI13_9HYPH|nr:AraC family transcriptional regulator [Phyllobacterium trifolii]MBB3148510.1 AraC-like DNA-binding protein [Phyllobacterium trifolii]